MTPIILYLQDDMEYDDKGMKFEKDIRTRING